MRSRLALNQELHAPSDRPSITKDMTDLVELDELSEADVKHERCPICKEKGLEKDEGFKICPRCQTMFKMLDGQGYIVGDDKPQPLHVQDYRSKGGLPIMSNRIISRMMKVAEAVEPLQQEQAPTTGNAILDAFNRIPKEKMQEWADKAVDNYITDNDYIESAADKYNGAENVTEENIIEDNLEYIEDYIWDDVINSDEFKDIEEIPDYGQLEATITETIKGLARASGTKQGWDKFFKLIEERMETEQEWDEENRDPWRGTGMSQKDFI